MKKFKHEFRRVTFNECPSSAGQWCLVLTESEDEDALSAFDIFDSYHQKMVKEEEVNVDDLPTEYLDLLKLKTQIVVFVNGDNITEEDTQNLQAACNLIDNDSLIARKPDSVTDTKELDRLVATRVYMTCVVHNVGKIDDGYLGLYNATILDLRDQTIDDLDKNIISLVQCGSQNFVAMILSDEVEAALDKVESIETQSMKYLREWVSHRKSCSFSSSPTSTLVRSLSA